jgi:hypothetical protein
VHEAALFSFLFIFACYGIVFSSISDLSLFQYNDAQFSCVFEKKNSYNAILGGVQGGTVQKCKVCLRRHR